VAEEAAAPERAPAPALSPAHAAAAPKPDPVRAEPSSEEIEPWLVELIAMRGREAPERLSLLELRRPGLVVGGLFAAVALAGGLAGWWSASDIQDDVELQGEAVALVDRPAERPSTASDASDVSEAVPQASTPLSEERVTEQARQPRAERQAPARAQASAAEAQPLASVDSFLAETPATAPEEAPDPTVPAQSASAPAVEQSRLPLPDRTVARTIERIGYACGKVASVTPMAEGSGGAFKVTCTSGDSYRAAPIRGRYHFRRLGGG
jgi:hypothetical protein